MFLAERWQDYELIDAGNGEKLERWGKVILRRPDPQAMWPHDAWPQADAAYYRSNKGGGKWQFRQQLPVSWNINYPSLAGKLTFRVEPTGFKHTGLFPEQAVNWDFCADQIKQTLARKREVRVLNLFAYTGAATAACAAAGATEIVHIDAAKRINGWARENLSLSGLEKCQVRVIADDVQKFVSREIRRGRRYEAIIMDPPAYGRGPSGELWQLEDALIELVNSCVGLLSANPLFFLINTYASALTAQTLDNILRLTLKEKLGGQIETSEIGLPMSSRSLILPCGCTGRWQM